jgi:hypothetical protein
MRFILGIIVGAVIMVGAAYISDTTRPPSSQPMVNWDVVSKNIDSLTAYARESLKKITG